MEDPLKFLITHCLHDPKGDAKIDLSAQDLDSLFDPIRVSFLRNNELLEEAPPPSFLRCSECGRTCTTPVIRSEGYYYLFCEDDCSRRLLEPHEIDRFCLSLNRLARFIAQRLGSTFRGNATENGIEICFSHGYLYCLEKTKTEWVLQIEDIPIPLIDAFYWRTNAYLLNQKQLSSALQNIGEYHQLEKKWSDEKLLELLEQHAKLKGNGITSPTKTLAKELDLSATQIKRLLSKAREIDKTTRK